MPSTKGPVRGTRIAGGRYYLIRADGTRRIWVPLSLVRDGLPAFYRALADANEAPKVAEDSITTLVAEWKRDVMPRHVATTQRDETAMCRTIAESLVDFTASQVRPPDVAEYLRPFAAKPRTYNAHRGMLRELMRYAEERGFREPGSNPVSSIRTMPTPPRDRYITDSELRRIKVAAMYGDDGKRTRSGQMVCALIDMAYLTGQRIGDLLALEWSAFGPEGIAFQPSKTSATTGARVLIEWTPKLRDVERRLRELRKERRGFAPQVFTSKGGTDAYRYTGASSAWRRAVARSGVLDCHFHDLRAKALTDKDRREGMGAARTMGAHATESQTAGYVRHKSARRTGATK